MDLELFKTKTVAALTAGADTGTASGILAELVDMATVAAAEIIQLQAALGAEQAANETLRKANMDLFLKIPVGAAAAEETKEEEPEDGLSMTALIDSGALQGLI